MFVLTNQDSMEVEQSNFRASQAAKPLTPSDEVGFGKLEIQKDGLVEKEYPFNACLLN